MENRFVTRRRTRMISFRVSEQEFELLKSRSDADGARNISDYARLALCRNDREANLETAVTQLSSEIQQLRAQLLQMTEFLASSGRTAAVPATPETTRYRRPAELQAKAEGRALLLATRKTGRA